MVDNKKDVIEQLKNITKNELKSGVSNPNEGAEGRLVSNKTGEVIVNNYDFDKIGDLEKQFVENVIEFMSSKNDVDMDTLILEMKHRYKIDKIPMKKIEDSLWYQFTKNEKIGANISGFRQTLEDGKQIRIPHVHFSSDLDYLDDMINRIIEKVRQLKIDT